MGEASRGGTDMGPSAGRVNQEKVYLKDLTLEDRERVLRLLFAKINIAHKATKPVTTDFDDEEFDNNQRAESQASSGAFYVTQMDHGEHESDVQGGSEADGGHYLPAI